MTEPPSFSRRWSALAACGLLVLGCAALGCRVPPARPMCGREGPLASRRTAAVGRELVADTAAQSAAHPAASAGQVVCCLARHAHRAACDVGFKRLALPVLPILPPDCPDDRPAAEQLQPAAVEVDIDGQHALMRLEALLDGAQERIDIQMYLWESDLLGWSLARRLARKAEDLARCGHDGPAVRVLIDRGGNLIQGPCQQGTTPEVNAAVCWLARQPHVEVLRGRQLLTHFDHRKLVVIDDRIAWTGGRNFTLLSFMQWHDVSFTVRGPLVEDLRRTFSAAWQDAGGTAVTTPHEQPLDAADVNASAAVVATGRRCCELAGAVYAAVDRARCSIALENPYFTDSVLLWKLARARQRGVDVRIIVAEESECRVTDRAMRPMVNRMLRAGIRVYQYPGTTHVKAALVDGAWLYMGTANFDGLSLYHNSEVGLVVGAGPLIGRVQHELFDPDLRAEWEVTQPYRLTPVDRAYDLLAGLFL